MNAQLKPIETPLLIRPSYRGWVHVQRDERDAWIQLNLGALKQWYAQTGSYAEHEDSQAAFTVFADIQYESEHARYLELLDDAKHEHYDEVCDDE